MTQTSFPLMSSNPLPALVVWLNDTYTMERALVRIAEGHIHDALNVPDLRARMEDHLNETRWHAQRIKECLAMLGARPSFSKIAWSTLSGRIQGVALSPFRGDLTKNLLSDYATEHREIACYRALITAATEAGQLEIADSARTFSARRKPWRNGSKNTFRSLPGFHCNHFWSAAK